MSTRTRSDMVLEVLDRMGVLAAGQTPSTDDTTRVDEAIDDIVEEMAELEIIYLPDLDNVPSPWFQSIAAYIADAVCSKFGVTGEERAGIAQESAAGVAKLKAMNRGRYTGEIVPNLYY